MIDLPYFSYEELWRQLAKGSESFGFYTNRTKQNIPNGPGIYAWYLPVFFNGEIGETITKTKHYFSYDVNKKDSLNSKFNVEYQWQNFDVSLKASNKYRKQKTIESTWHELKENFSSEDEKAFSQILMMGSIFNKPLYIGLSKSLSARYEQHVTGTERNSFFTRFSEFSRANNLDIDMSNLIFMTISLPNKYSKDQGLVEKQLKVLEYIFKNVNGPVFGEI